MSVILSALRALAVPALFVGVIAGLAIVSSGSSVHGTIQHTSGTLAPQPIVKGVTLHLEPPSWVAPVTDYRLTGRFGAGSSLWSRAHTGLDLATASGAPIRSVADGVVTSAAYDGAYGYKTVVELKDGTEIWYCHQSSLEAGTGDRLDAGDVLGYVGTSGNVTGPHLHLEVRPGGGDPVDPYTALAAEGLRL